MGFGEMKGFEYLQVPSRSTAHPGWKRTWVPRPGASGGGSRGGTWPCCPKSRLSGKVTAFGWQKSDVSLSRSGREGGAVQCRQSRAGKRAFLASSSSSPRSPFRQRCQNSSVPGSVLGERPCSTALARFGVPQPSGRLWEPGQGQQG